MTPTRRLLLSTALVALASCARDGDSTASTAPSPDGDDGNVIVQEKERGPVQVELRVEPKEPSYAERIRFTIAARAEEGVRLTLPSPGENLGQFLVRDYVSQPSKATSDGRRESSQEYVLEVVMSGEYTIPSMQISFIDGREEIAAETANDAAGDEPTAVSPAGGDPENDGESEADSEPEEEKVYKILTDPIVVKVTSLADPGELETLKPNAPQAEPPVVPENLRWPLIIGGSCLGLALAAGLAVFLLRVLRRERVRRAPKIPPEELAYRELEWLIAQRFADRGEFKEFYFHLSRIVREYIERRFGLRAPESTTEEFLDDLARSDALEAGHKLLLRDFLEKADLVKFARYDPGPEEIESSFEAAKRFIAETRPRVEEVAGVE